MSLGVPIPNVDPDALAALTTALGSTWPALSPPIVLYPAPGGANATTHIVAIDQAQERFGLKAADRGGVDRGSEREQVIATLAVTLGMPLAPRTYVQTPIANLPMIRERTFVASWWHRGTAALDKLDNALGRATKDAILAHPGPFLEAFGSWYAFGLLFGAQDRNAGNWIVSEDGASMAMIDAEESLRSEASVPEYRIPLNAVQLLNAVTAAAGRGRNLERSAVIRGIRRGYNSWAEHHSSVRATLGANQVCSTFRSRWMGLGRKTFIDEAVAGLA